MKYLLMNMRDIDINRLDEVSKFHLSLSIVDLIIVVCLLILELLDTIVQGNR